MTLPPAHPKIYHIVNVDRLPSIIAHGRLLCDSEIVKLQLPGTTIGMGSIKARRLQLPVTCYANAVVGDFVPFYFCPRSVMLYVIRCANSPELTPVTSNCKTKMAGFTPSILLAIFRIS